MVVGINPNCAKTFAKLGAFILTTLCQTYEFPLENAGVLCRTVLLYTWASVIEEQTSPPLKEIAQKGLAIQQYLATEMQQELALCHSPEVTTQSFFNQGLSLIIAGTEKAMQEQQ